MADDSCILCNSTVHDKNYCLIAELYQETTAIPLQLKLVSEGKLKRHQRKSSRQTQGRLFSLWDNYSNNISASRLLKDCVGIYAPTPTQWIDSILASALIM
jgi:hypothetical protein